MELDELKERWAEHDRKLDLKHSPEPAIAAGNLHSAGEDSRCGGLAAMLAAGAIFMLVVIVFLGPSSPRTGGCRRFMMAGDCVGHAGHRGAGGAERADRDGVEHRLQLSRSP